MIPLSWSALYHTNNGARTLPGRVRRRAIRYLMNRSELTVITNTRNVTVA